MDEEMIQFIIEGCLNIGYWREQDYWSRNQLEEALELLENKEHYLEEYDCYDYLFE